MPAHKKNCQCDLCGRKRFNAWKDRVELMTERPVPTTREALIPVRAHFRKNPKYLSKDDVLRALVKGFISGLVSNNKRKTA